MRDRHGHTVEVRTIDGRQVYVARMPNGILLGRSLGDGRPELTTPDELAAAGVDLATLR